MNPLRIGLVCLVLLGVRVSAAEFDVWPKDVPPVLATAIANDSDPRSP